MLPQPPTDALAPPSSAGALRSRRQMKWLWIVGVGSFIAFILAAAVVVLLAFGFKRGLTPRNLANEDPTRAFESFVCSPPATIGP